MVFEELQNRMPNCVICRHHCPIGELRCDRGKEMAERIMAGEADPEEYIRWAEERRKAREAQGETWQHGHGRHPEFPEGGPDHRRHGPWDGRRGPHGPEGFAHGPEGRGPHGPAGFGTGPEGRGPHGPESFGPGPGGFRGGPGMPPGRPPMPRPMPRDDSLGALLFYAAHAFRPEPPRGGGRGGPGMGQRRVLRLLAETESISQQSLQEILAIRPGSLSELLGKLEHKGLIARTQDEADRRKNSLSLTDEGRRVLNGLDEQADPFAFLTEEEKEMLKGLLKKIIEANR